MRVLAWLGAAVVLTSVLALGCNNGGSSVPAGPAPTAALGLPPAPPPPPHGDPNKPK